MFFTCSTWNAALDRAMSTASNPPLIGELLASRIRLEISCTECHRSVLWSPEQAAQILGARTPFVVARERLYCAPCRERGLGEPGQSVTARPSMADYYANLRARGHMG